MLIEKPVALVTGPPDHCSYPRNFPHSVILTRSSYGLFHLVFACDGSRKVTWSRLPPTSQKSWTSKGFGSFP